MGADPERTKKLLGDRLELLRWRVAAKLGFASVEAWERETTARDRANMIALAIIDAWGEEWCETKLSLAMQTRATLVSAGADPSKLPATTLDDVRRKFVGINDESKEPEIDWQAAAAAFKNLAVR